MSGALSVRELTPPGRGGVRVLELRGPGALAALRRLAPGVRGRAGAPELVRLGTAGDGGLDEALVVAGPGDALELHLTGSPPLVARVRELLGGTAADDAEPRTLEDRALARLRAAPSAAAARMLLDQARGALRAELVRILAFRDDAAFAAATAGLLGGVPVARRLLEPPEVVLAGPTNAGKSTLFNALYGSRRVVVSPVEGTTRDVITERVTLGAWVVSLTDAAGERPVEGADDPAALEREGQRRARREWGRADLVVWLAPADGPPAPPPAAPAPVRALRSRADLARVDPAEPSISAVRDPAGACATFAALVREALELPEDPWVPGAPVVFDPELGRLLARGAGRDELAAWLAGVTAVDRGPGRP